MRRAFLSIGLAWAAAAQGAPGDRVAAARDLISKAAQALTDRRPAGFLEALDRPLAGQLRKPVEALLQSYDLRPALQFESATADDRGVALAIDWKLDLTAREGQRGITHRERRFECRVEPRDGALRIVSLDGASGASGFFSLPAVDGAWDLMETAARALNQEFRSADPPPSVPVRAAGFMSLFDPAFPGYEALRSGVEGLMVQGEVDSSIELTGNEGTDTARTIEADWTLEVVNADTGIRILRREADLTFHVERRGKRWLIVSLAPLDFFTK